MDEDKMKKASDILVSKRFVSYVVYIVATFLVFPILSKVFPEVFGAINMDLFVENATDVVLLLIGGYSAQDAFRALKKK